MHAALMPDLDRLSVERDWFNRTVVGLVTSGVQVTRLLSDDDIEDERIALAPAAWYRRPRLPWMRRASVAGLVQEIPTSHPPDVIHAMGRDVWPVALRLCRELSCPLALDVWSADDLKAAVRFSRHDEVNALITATARLGNAAVELVDPAIVQCIPIGVHMPDASRKVFSQPDSSVAIVIAGRGAGMEAVGPLLDGLASIIETYPQVMIFIDLEPSTMGVAWRRMARLGLRERVSVIPPTEEHRDLVHGVDAIVVPAAVGRASSALPQYMSEGMAVVAIRDPYIDDLDESEAIGPALLLEPPVTATGWAEAIVQLLKYPDSARQLSERAKMHAEKEHAMSQQIRLLRETYENMCSGGTFRYEDAKNAPS